MLRNILFVLFVLLLSVGVAHANLVLNGGFENNSATVTSTNLFNADFNSLMNNVTAFGAADEIDLYKNSSFPQSEDWVLGLHTQGATVFDSFSLDLSSSISAGTAYNLQFFAAGVPFLPDLYKIGPIQIGLSDIATDFGDLIFSSSIPIRSTTEWTQFDYSFNATMDKSFLTVRTDSSVAGNYVYVDNFSLTAAPVPEPSTFLLLGGGLAGLAFYTRRRRKE